MIESPCVRVCRMEDGRCVGCGRTREEIAGWLAMSDAQRVEVMRRVSGQNLRAEIPSPSVDIKT